MISNLNKLITDDCIVVQIGNYTVYPIFKCGFSSIVQSPSAIQIKNKNIKNLKTIDVIIRDPKERFVLGFKEYCWNEKIFDVQSINETYKKVKQNKIVDRHFIPQFIWLMHLSKYFKGSVTFRKMSYLKKLTSLHKNKVGPYQEPKKVILMKQKVKPLNNFVTVDEKLLKYYNQTVLLTDIIKRYKNVLS